jgi:xanthine dehydrogenase accessory factor
MEEFFTQVKDELNRGRDICLATIVDQLGSAPRHLGTRFLVRTDGSFRGTIGGGLLEHTTIQAAREAIREKRIRMLHFRLKGSDVADSDMLCGGDVDIFLEPVSAADQKAARVYKAAADLAASGGQGVLATKLDEDGPAGQGGRHLLLADGRDTMGSAGQDPELEPLLKEILAEGDPAQAVRRVKLAGGDYLVEFLAGRPVVFLFGGGHISLWLAKLVAMTGFRLVVVDDRPEYANPERFPEADEVWVRDFTRVLDAIHLGPEAYVVIVTRGHIFDKEVLGQALKQQPAYLGMIGSKRKRAVIYKALKDEGVSPDLLAKVRSPIGMDIGAQTPEEIAVSIIAELIAVRAHCQARFTE